MAKPKTTIDKKLVVSETKVSTSRGIAEMSKTPTVHFEHQLKPSELHILYTANTNTPRRLQRVIVAKLHRTTAKQLRLHLEEKEGSWTLATSKNGTQDAKASPNS
ncbi:hypothetical protein OsI_27910 [Oryza sativa Indica Group]|uniref:Uncharacterized protein n=1 Tax=Oryza sativa subsp. indica TaxID=39946 RepID=A2YRG9_ORYSI|nr:hypothetical protein OsI_27910 [Oryza sativa Indica Group]